MKYEILPTHQAAGLFNFLAEDARYIAAALINPSLPRTLDLERPKGLPFDKLSEEIDGEIVEEKKLLKTGSDVKTILKQFFLYVEFFFVK